ncbi:MAG: CoA pyrophosphatase [Spirochaetales bacterium]|nr:CoA pyrophosphatase [Spirochaetales bacterium]
MNLVEDSYKNHPSKLIGSEESFRSAVLVPFMFVNGKEYILFEKRAANIRQGSEICFPGGMIDEEDGTSIETVIRETVEETGIKRDAISVYDNAAYLVTRTGALIDVYTGRIEIESFDDFSPNPDEVERLIPIPVSFFIENEPDFYHYRLTVEPWYINEDGNKVDLFPSEELGLPERYWKPWSHERERFVVYKYDGEVIWGITARIMNTVTRLMKKSVS